VQPCRTFLIIKNLKTLPLTGNSMAIQAISTNSGAIREALKATKLKPEE